MESGELEKTFADCELLYNLIGFKPSISINEGLPKFVNWYKLFKDKKMLTKPVMYPIILVGNGRKIIWMKKSILLRAELNKVIKNYENKENSIISFIRWIWF